LRHQEKYPYKNIWLSLAVKDPDTTSIIKREFTLADNNKWLGTTIDDITDHRIIFNPQPIKLKKGSYSFTLKQIMRDDPLPNILSAGIRVQKVGQ
jgi:gliding motility-associated lipoprotein GldH